MAEEETEEPSRGRSLNIKQVAELMNVSERTVYNWIHAGKVEYFKTPGGRYRIYESSLRKRDQREEDELR